MRRLWWRRGLRLVGAGLALMLAGTYLVLWWLVELPGPGGPHLVGQKVWTVADPDRADPWLENARRELVVYLFFPTEQHGPRAEYFPHLDQLARHFEGADSLLIRLVPHFVASSASEQVEPLTGPEPFPVVLFSPGAGTPIFLYRGLLEDLASHGYLVAAVEPTGEGVGQVFPDGRVVGPVSNQFEPEPDTAEARGIAKWYRQRVEVRAADLSLVVDRLEALNREAASPWAGRIATARVASLGHSLGGIAAVEAARRDPRIVATVNLGGHFQSSPCLPDDQPAASHATLLIIEDRSPVLTDEQLKQLGMTREQHDREVEQRQIEVGERLARVFGTARTQLVEDIQHSDYSDEPFYYPYWTSASRDQALARLSTIRRRLLAFFDEQLR